MARAGLYRPYGMVAARGVRPNAHADPSHAVVAGAALIVLCWRAFAQPWLRRREPSRPLQTTMQRAALGTYSANTADREPTPDLQGCTQLVGGTRARLRPRTSKGEGKQPDLEGWPARGVNQPRAKKGHLGAREPTNQDPLRIFSSTFYYSKIQ